MRDLKVLLGTCGGWYLPNTSRALLARDSLAGFWTTGKNATQLPKHLFHRCWPFHVAMKPFYHLAPQAWTERAFYSFFPLWKQWALSQRWPECNVVHAIMGYGTELFARAEGTGALRVIDAQNSHPTSYYGYWQREFDLWCPGQKATIPRWMFARMNREVEMADLIVCPSVFVRDTMLTNGLPAEKCVVNPFGVDTDIFVPRDKLPERPRFVSVGTICVRKGYQYLFRAFEQVKRQIPEAELICVGAWNYDFRYERKKWEGTFTHHPHLSHLEIAQLLRQCSAFVFGSVEEGFARVIVEAMASGLPIIATYESGATTLVRDNVEGLIVRARDPAHFAEAMIKLARDRDLNTRTGHAARARGGAGNSWQDYGDRMLRLYSERRETLLR